MAGDCKGRTASPPTRAVLLATAEELELWAADLPGWISDTSEPLEALQHRRAAAEATLVQRLRGLPGCCLTTKENGALVELVLHGLRVRSADRLKGACLAWITEARRRAGALPA